MECKCALFENVLGTIPHFSYNLIFDEKAIESSIIAQDWLWVT